MPAGFLFTINKASNKTATDAVTEIIERGCFSVLVSARWNQAIAATLGDHICMKPGDNVYFFSKRMVYGVGTILDVTGSGDGAFEIEEGSSTKAHVPDKVVEIGARLKTKRWGFVFKPSPYFFSTGMDMDDLLQTNPNAFKALRTFWKRSFI